ncbi:SpoIIE family protein phosphatase [Streptomyces sp. TRM S81-3]|uniref:protein-serine/threonine phosphatase n=1 Tax=Streptomyces griseicoloratus TaxID=2752516 RepID=A0A926L757_9ACTN|nr:SpoIIE family protein phosphatase [Streptomyces griseicoloratus]MBD0423885.1 SpoIIE family protein phosphatase [Streptomyces griseicoloratus]
MNDAGPALRALLTGSVVGLAVWDTDLRCVWANDALERYDGIAREQRLGRRPRDSLTGDSDRLEALIRRVLAGGHCVTGREYRVPAVAGKRRDRAFSASFVRLEDADGRILGVCMLILVVTDRRWAGDRLAVVSEAGARIGTTLDVMRTAQELADYTVPLIADYVTVDLTEAVRFGEEPLDRLGPSCGRVPKFRRAGRASVHTGAPESLWSIGEVVYVPETSPFTQVLYTGRPLLEPLLDTSHDTWLADDPARAAKIREFGMHSLLILPVHARGVLLGVAVFVRTSNPTPFDENDQLLAEELVARAALSLDNARRYTRERNTALALQRSLLPRRVHGGTAMEVAARYLPADAEDGVGGDWFDVIGLPGGRLALVVGDVVGHGVAAAATMGRLRTAIRTLADLDLPPGELLTRLDRTFIRLTEDEEAAETEIPSLGATCVYAVYDPATRKCTLALAGHPPPAVVHPDSGVSFPDLPHGTPLGLGMLAFPTAELDLPAGTLIALFSDGLVEDRHQDIDVGLRRLGRALTQRTASLEDLCTAAIATLPTTPPPDDVTLLLARGL